MNHMLMTIWSVLNYENTVSDINLLKFLAAVQNIDPKGLMKETKENSLVNIS